MLTPDCFVLYHICGTFIFFHLSFLPACVMNLCSDADIADQQYIYIYTVYINRFQASWSASSGNPLCSSLVICPYTILCGVRLVVMILELWSRVFRGFRFKKIIIFYLMFFWLNYCFSWFMYFDSIYIVVRAYLV